MKRNMFGALMTLIVACTLAVPVVHAQTIMTANVPFAFFRKIVSESPVEIAPQTQKSPAAAEPAAPERKHKK